jgi:hypothetical protein
MEQTTAPHPSIICTHVADSFCSAPLALRLACLPDGLIVTRKSVAGHWVSEAKA